MDLNEEVGSKMIDINDIQSENFIVVGNCDFGDSVDELGSCCSSNQKGNLLSSCAYPVENDVSSEVKVVLNDGSWNLRDEISTDWIGVDPESVSNVSSAKSDDVSEDVIQLVLR